VERSRKESFGALDSIKSPGSQECKGPGKEMPVRMEAEYERGMNHRTFNHTRQKIALQCKTKNCTHVIAALSVSGIRGREKRHHSGTLSGFIRDARTGTSIEGALVSVPCGLTTRTVRSDSSGFYIVPELPPGSNIPVYVSSDGYMSENTRISLEPGTAAELDISLTTGRILLIHPNGGEALFAGAEILITWNSAGVERVVIEWSFNGGRDWLLITATADAGGGVLHPGYTRYSLHRLPHQGTRRFGRSHS